MSAKTPISGPLGEIELRQHNLRGSFLNIWLSAGPINMRERIGLIGGELEIHSHPGRGTRIEARAPIAKETF